MKLFIVKKDGTQELVDVDKITLYLDDGTAFSVYGQDKASGGVWNIKKGDTGFDQYTQSIAPVNKVKINA